MGVDSLSRTIVKGAQRYGFTHSEPRNALTKPLAYRRGLMKPLAALLLAHSPAIGMQSLFSIGSRKNRAARMSTARNMTDKFDTTSGNGSLSNSGISRRVAVIGGGCAGVIAARFLKRAGHEPKIFEAGSSFGGVWAERPSNTVVYKNLKTNLPTCVMQSPDLDFPAGVPSYITKNELGTYIESYAHEFGVASVTTFGATVTKVTPVDATSGEDHWIVEWTCNGTSYVETFDAVVVGNGHYEEPYKPTLPGEAEWLAADSSRTILHSREYDDPEDFRGQTVLVVGGRSSGVDISRELHGIAKWVYVLEKKCTSPMITEDESVTHVPLGTRLSSDGRLRIRGELIPGPPVGTVVLATGYNYAFPFLDEATLGMSFCGKRFVTPLYQHLIHAGRPTLGFVGIPLSIPCPIPFFEIQAAYLAEHWARPSSGPDAMTSAEEREAWVRERCAAVGDRTQDTHLTNAVGESAWGYMRALLADVHTLRPPTSEGESWLERSNWDARLSTVEDVYQDRVKRYPKLPWHQDLYRRCEYFVDWGSGQWSVDDSKAQPGVAQSKRED